MADSNRLTIGWREWVSLPELSIPAIKAKVDTGARTSALHAFSLVTFEDRGTQKVKFCIHPLQNRKDIVSCCVADVIDRRKVVDSGGHSELRYVIRTQVRLGTRHLWSVEMTLTDRDTMRFRMLLGRSAIFDRALINPGKSYMVGKKPPLHTLYGPGLRK